MKLLLRTHSWTTTGLTPAYPLSQQTHQLPLQFKPNQLARTKQHVAIVQQQPQSRKIEWCQSTRPSNFYACIFRHFPMRDVCPRSTHFTWPSLTSACFKQYSIATWICSIFWTVCWPVQTRSNQHGYRQVI